MTYLFYFLTYDLALSSARHIKFPVTSNSILIWIKTNTTTLKLDNKLMIFNPIFRVTRSSLHVRPIEFPLTSYPLGHFTTFQSYCWKTTRSESRTFDFLGLHSIPFIPVLTWFRGRWPLCHWNSCEPFIVLFNFGIFYVFFVNFIFSTKIVCYLFFFYPHICCDRSSSLGCVKQETISYTFINLSVAFDVVG